MEVILLERIERLGQMGDVVRVKPGFARNYLLPQKKAMRATPDNLAHFESQRGQLEATNLERRGEAEAVAGKLDGLSLVLVRQAGESGQLYGSVTTRDLAAALDEAGFTVARNQIQLDSSIKALGLYDVRISLHPEVTVTVTINVARTEEEAKAQAKEAAEKAAEGEAAAEAPPPAEAPKGKAGPAKRAKAKRPAEEAEAPGEAGAETAEGEEAAAEPPGEKEQKAD
jgi:large subunit ribosomal protein L9